MVAWGKGDGNPLPADTAQEIRSLYGKTTTADVIGTQPVYLLGMDRSVLTRSIANTAQKAFSKLNSTVVPKLADTVSSANFIQMLNAQSAALNSVAAGKQMTGEEVWALLIQNLSLIHI